MTVRAPTAQNPQRVPGSDGWVWWRDKHGYPHARHDGLQLEVQVDNSTSFTALLHEIRKAEGGAKGERCSG